MCGKTQQTETGQAGVPTVEAGRTGQTAEDGAKCWFPLDVVLEVMPELAGAFTVDDVHLFREGDSKCSAEATRTAIAAYQAQQV